MRISLHLQTLVCILAAFVLPPQSLAQDDTNASLIPLPVWGTMKQVMGSGSVPPSGAIKGPFGIYANVQLSSLLDEINTWNTSHPKQKITDIDSALTNYFLLLLDNQAVSGLLLQARWSDLNPYAPSCLRFAPRCLSPYAWNYLDDAFHAINAWNQNPANSGPLKTLQLDVLPGFWSPGWLFNELSSCDGLFMSPQLSVSSSCGYTTIFWQTESASTTYQMPLPLPWNPTYKSEWQAFLAALNEHIASHPTFVSSLVSIGVAGPTASSTEIILPNETNNANYVPLTLDTGLPPGYPPVVPPGYSAVPVTTVADAWTSLLQNSYGVTSSNYVDSDRAFIEEWNAAIDMYGQIFSGVTLTVDMAIGGLPDFPAAEDSGSSALLTPPPAFAPYGCGTDATLAMDCSAETAILAYFAEPPVGGANAKATAEDGLAALGATATGPHADAAASVKWLSQSTSAADLTAEPGVVGGTMPVVSRMLGGLQLAKSIYTHPTWEGCSPPTLNATCPGSMVICPTGTCTGTPTPEQALLYVLTNYFAGTSVGYEYGVASGTTFTGSFTNAPINYLQIWDTDFLYAKGYVTNSVTGNPDCTTYDLMSNNPSNLKKCQVDMTAYTVPFQGKNMTAQELLNLANRQILGITAEAVTLPPVCCASPYVPRGAFGGDYVCVLPTVQSQALTENAKAQSNYSPSYTNLTKTPIVRYGLCLTGLQWRQAYMGDYVCVSSAQETQVVNDNTAFQSRLCPPRPPPPCHPLTTCR